MFLKPNIPMFAWATVIAVLTLTPGHSLPNFDMFAFDGIDLLAHCVVFGILGALMSGGFKKQSLYPTLRENTGLVVVLICTVYGLSIEFLQIIIPGRGLEIYDMIANSIGGGLGFYFYTLAIKFKTWI